MDGTSSRTRLGLLGVVSIYEHVAPTQWREYWWRLAQDSPELPRRPVPFVPAALRKDR